MLAVGREVAAVGREEVSGERLQALKRIIPCSTIKSILKSTRQNRKCCRLPKYFMVWFVIGMGLFATDCYRQVFRWLQRYSPGKVPYRSTLTEARRRLGVAPLWCLLQRVVELLAKPTTPGAFYRGMRLMAVDGFVVDLADTRANADTFGRPQSGRTPGAFPQLRVLALCEVGTHVLWKCLMKPLRCAEMVMVQGMFRHLQAGMLLLWDRGFHSYEHVRSVKDREAHLLARIKKNLVFTRFEALADGSSLTKIYPATWYRQHDREGIEVRVIEYTIDDPARGDSTKRHRLLTTLLDAREHPAERLVELYHERWEEELAIDELKTHQRQRPVLRSQSPAGVIQEMCGLLLAHFALRRVMFEAAAVDGVPPRRMSFTGALKILRCRLPECPQSPRALRTWYADLVKEIAEEQLPKRVDRLNPREVRRKMSKWPKKQKRPPKTRPVKKFIDVVKIQ